MVDYAGLLVENRLRITVLPDRRINSLPDVELLTGPATIAQGSFIRDIVPHREQAVAQIIAHGGLFDLFIRAL